MGLFDDVFDDDDDASVLGKPHRLKKLRHLPTTQRQIRPGRLSTALKLHQRQLQQKARKGPPKGLQNPFMAPGGMMQRGGPQVPNPFAPGGAMQRGGVNPFAPGGGMRKPAPNPFAPGGGAAARGRGTQFPTPPMQRGGARRRSPFLSGPDDGTGDGTQPDTSTTFNPNGQVWVTAVDLPLVALSDPNGAGIHDYGDTTGGGRMPRVLWPDGTEVFGRFWFPKFDLTKSFTPVFGQGDQAGDPRQRGGDGTGMGGWLLTEGAGQLFGTPAAWEYVVDYNCDQDPINSNPKVWLNPKQGLFWWDQIDHTCTGLDNSGGLFGTTRYVYHWASIFDWSQSAPTQVSPIWLWLNFWDPTNIAMTVFDAEIYRLDGQTIEAGGEPTELPGRAWLLLDWLDAIQTGAHGVPVMVRSDGSLDPDIFSQFLRDNPAWAPLLTFGPTNKGMVAIINDVGAKAGGVVTVQPQTNATNNTTDPSGGAGDLNQNDNVIFQALNQANGSGGDGSTPPLFPPDGGSGDNGGGNFPPGGGGYSPYQFDQSGGGGGGGGGYSPYQFDQSGGGGGGPMFPPDDGTDTGFGPVITDGGDGNYYVVDDTGDTGADDGSGDAGDDGSDGSDLTTQDLIDYLINNAGWEPF